MFAFRRALCYIGNAGRFLQVICLPGLAKDREVMRMKDYEILMVVLTIIGLVLAAITLGIQIVR